MIGALLAALSLATAVQEGDAGTTNLDLCRCPDNHLQGSYKEIEVAGFPRLRQDPATTTVFPRALDDEDPDRYEALFRNAAAADGSAMAHALCVVENDWEFGVATTSGVSYAVFEAEQRWHWEPATEDQPATSGGTELAASYSISGFQEVAGEVGPTGFIFDDPATSGSVSTYGAYFDLTCLAKFERAHALMYTASNVTGSSKHIESALESGKDGKGIGGKLAVTKGYGNPIYRVKTPIIGGGVINLRTSASTIIVKRSGAAVAAVAAWTDGSTAQSFARTTLKVEFNAPTFKPCSYPDDGDVSDGLEPTPDTIGD